MQQLHKETADLLFMLPTIKGTSIYANFDGLDLTEGAALICGWAFDRANPDSTLEILIFGEKGLIGRGKVELARPDVSEAGVPRVDVGFRVRLKPRGDEKELKIVVQSGEQQHLLHELRLTEGLPPHGLTREDVVSVFSLLFHRYPESEDAINHQLSVHKSKASLFAALFRSPEFHEKNMDVIALMHANAAGK
ncbi:hypothetical protein [Azospirillum sp. SYSU D00513]|uniref:hypothetical protein n=1 Tax=Azospirillum sp. SYSU D00513 TaxID=2812561 RepID=UPI001A96983B|nr:hypothetical protein [Azospirillum sp. SYSU D00513]